MDDIEAMANELCGHALQIAYRDPTFRSCDYDRFARVLGPKPLDWGDASQADYKAALRDAYRLFSK
jgi:hypothetical protein